MDKSVDVRAALRMASFVRINVAVLDSRSDRQLQADRTASLIRRSDPEAYRLILSLDGRMRCAQGDGQARFRRGDLAVFDTSQPFVWLRDAGMDPCRMVMVTLPRRLVTVPAARIQGLLCRALAGGRLRVAVRGLLAGFADRLEAFEQLHRAEVAGMIGTLVEGLLAEQAGLPVTAGLTGQGLVLRARAVIVERGRVKWSVGEAWPDRTGRMCLHRPEGILT